MVSAPSVFHLNHFRLQERCRAETRMCWIKVVPEERRVAARASKGRLGRLWESRRMGDSSLQTEQKGGKGGS